MSEESFKMKPWMWFLMIIAVLLLIFNFDPVGNALEKAFGKGAEKWAMNIMIIGILIYSFFIRRNKKQ